MTVDALRHGPVADAIRRHRLLVVLRRLAPRSAVLDMVTELADAGARIFEVTFDAPTGDADLVAVREHLRHRADGPFLLGAGTVLRRGQLEAARRAGADFAVAPLLDPDLVATAVAEGLPFIPGAFTPTEIARAWAAGATFVKLFPAAAVGPTFVRELRGPMPDVELIPTGGIDAANARSFLDAGAAAVGIGGAITRADPEARRAIVAVVALPGGTGELPQEPQAAPAPSGIR
jgi:2-dehydro-3-deoxyphosphogluconate aldolase/(4S)-4-hydroxy-2-oxoglutarate aldolase